MNKYPVIRICWYAVNVLMAVSLGRFLYGAIWEFSTQSYLKGFSDAIIPSSDNPKQKVESILAWMAHGPTRRSASDPGNLALRDSEETLNIDHLLKVCGTATNAFVNLAESSGLHTRRLLLLDEKTRTSKHLDVEVLTDDRWVVVDPSYRSFLHLPNGDLVTSEELKSPVIFHLATLTIPNYPQTYTYEATANVRVRRIPLIGPHLRGILDYVWPSWEEAINWTLLVERESFVMLVVSSLLLCFALSARLFLGWYCSRQLGIARLRLRDQIVRAGHLLVENAE
jgi:hypothetical protein